MKSIYKSLQTIQIIYGLVFNTTFAKFSENMTCKYFAKEKTYMLEIITAT